MRFRQPPGPTNALGQVKFVMPNPFNVYLHDTPSRELFDQPRLDFSSGCIRVADPLELAAWMLQREAGWDRAANDRTVAAGAEVGVPVSEPVPVHLQYATAWVDEHGVLQLRDDLYQRDPRLIEALREPPPQAGP